MTIKEKIAVAVAIQATAAKEGTSFEEARRQMQLALDEAWAVTDPVTRRRQNELFPEGKPTVEEFILVLAKKQGRR